ncbi:hypothetical protein F2Q69_00023482 [Brassica cretica]|nr:hypothetical protein F2Q69_00023482 [Brassica cretica]
MLPNQVIVHKNPSPENVIAGVFDERVTRKKKIDSKEMNGAFTRLQVWDMVPRP